MMIDQFIETQVAMNHVSVIIPVSSRYDDARTVWSAYCEALKRSGRSFELIYVFDGPNDPYVKEIAALADQVGNIRQVKLARAFGEAACIEAGIKEATGETLLILPAFLQVDPGAIPQLLERANNCDVVAGARDRRADTIFNRLRGWWFGSLAHAAGSVYRDPGCVAKVIHRRVFEELRLQSDQQFFLPYLAERLGFRVEEVVLPQAASDRAFRPHRPTDYIGRLMDIVALAFLMRFLYKPFRFFGTIGALLIAIGTGLGAALIFEKFVLQMSLADRPALLLTILLLVLGFQIAAVGLIAEIIIFSRGRGAPVYRIETIISAALPSPLPSDSIAKAS